MKQKNDTNEIGIEWLGLRELTQYAAYGGAGKGMWTGWIPKQVRNNPQPSRNQRLNLTTRNSCKLLK